MYLLRLVFTSCTLDLGNIIMYYLPDDFMIIGNYVYLKFYVFYVG